MEETQDKISTPGQNKSPATFHSLNAKKKNFWRVIYFLVTVMSAFLLKKVYLYQTLPEFENHRKGSIYDLLFFGLPFAAAFTGFDLLVHYIFDDWCLHHILTDERYEGSARPKRAYTLVKWMYSIFYYLVSSTAAYYLLKDTSFFPTWLGGSGTCHNYYICAQSLPEATLALKIFYVLQFGKHLSRTFSHMFIRSEGNYYEYVLHHSLSTFLILFSYLTNMWMVGTMVLFCHDFSDLFLITARCYKDVKFCNKNILQVIYVLGFTTWVSTRLAIFPACCVYAGIASLKSTFLDVADPLSIQLMTVPYLSMITMLGFLLVLQVFWTYYILQSFVSVNISTKVSHNYD